jgi:hypothetical protein
VHRGGSAGVFDEASEEGRQRAGGGALIGRRKHAVTQDLQKPIGHDSVETWLT